MNPLAILLYGLTFLLVPPSGAAVSTIVDDIDQNISYAPPSEGWNQGEDCSACTIHPDGSQAHGGTWRDTTSLSNAAPPHSFEYRFTGTGITVFNIICNQVVNGQTTDTNLQFFLNGKEDGNGFSHTPDPSGAPFVYNVPVYSTSGLQNGEHILRVQALPGVDSLVLFDYLQVTQNDPAPPPASITSTSAITTFTTSSTTFVSSSTTPSSSSVTSSSAIPTTSSTSTSGSQMSSSSSLSTSPITPSHPGADTLNIPPVTASSTMSSSRTQAGSSSQTVPLASSSTPASQAASIPVGLVAGATAGGVGTLIFLVISVILLRNRARNSSVSHLHKEKPGDSDSGSFGPGNDYDNNRHIPVMPSFPASASESVLLIGNEDHSRLSHTTGQSHASTSPGLSYSDSDGTTTPRIVSNAADSAIWQYRYQDSVDLETAAPSSAFLPRSSRQSTVTGMQMHDMYGSPIPPLPVTLFAPASSDPSRPLPRVPPREAESDGPPTGPWETSVAGQPGLGEPASDLIAALQEEIVRLREQNLSTPPPQYDPPPAQERAVVAEPQFEEKTWAYARTLEQEEQRAHGA